MFFYLIKLEPFCFLCSVLFSVETLSQYIAQTSFELSIFLSQLLQCLDSRHAPLCWLWVIILIVPPCEKEGLQKGSHQLYKEWFNLSYDGIVFRRAKKQNRRAEGEKEQAGGRGLRGRYTPAVVMATVLMPLSSFCKSRRKEPTVDTIGLTTNWQRSFLDGRVTVTKGRPCL